MNIKEAGFRALSAEEIKALDFNPFVKIGDEWFLVTAGDENGWNTMTASWGFAGIMWGKNSFITAIRPQRHTKTFIDKSEYFTASFFPENMKKALAYCGSHSGRDVDKAKETGLEPIFIDTDDGKSVTAFSQASLILVCKKTYVQQMTSDSFVIPEVDKANYAAGDYHTEYIGEITAVYVK